MARSSGRDALNHAIAAADLYMKAAKEAASPADRVRFRKKCEGLITHAEQLKSSPRATPATTTKATTVITSASNPNCHVRQIPSNERAILLRSSRLHGNIFPPWQSDPVDGTFSLPEGKHVFSYVESIPLPRLDKTPHS